jgi:hypothetical protein
MVLRKPSLNKINSKKRKVLHLGNVGEDAAFRSKSLAERFPNFKFYGIDLKHITSKSNVHESMRFILESLKKERFLKPVPENLIQYQADFLKGLSYFKPNSIDLAVSDFALGFYRKANTFKQLKVLNLQAILINRFKGARKYTFQVLSLLHQKMKPGGKVIIYVFKDDFIKDNYFNNVLLSLKQNFTDVKISLVDVNKFDSKFKTYYFNTLKKNTVIYKLTAKK